MNEVYNVSADLNTRYMVNELLKMFKEYIESHEPGSTFDIAGCKLGPEIEAYIYSSMDNYKYINSKDPKLNDILASNWRCKNFRENNEEWEPLSFSNKSLDDILRMIKEQPAGNYELVCGYTDAKARAGAMIFIMARPDVNIDLGGHAYFIFNKIKEHRTNLDISHDEYYYYKKNIVFFFLYI